jgi:cysteinyl-tRNA synthetase
VLINAAERASGEDDAGELTLAFQRKFVEAMDQDFNTRAAVSEMFELVREVNRLLADGKLSRRGALSVLGALEDMNSVFGILPTRPESGEDRSGEIVDILIEVRGELRKRKQYDLADKIRDRLKERGIELQDTAEGVRWKRTGK